MRRSTLRGPKHPIGFRVISMLPKVCSAITLGEIDPGYLRKLNKEELIRNIETMVVANKVNISLSKIKTVQITLNHDRFWCWGTPWKFAYSYKGNMGNCSVFYINFK